MAALLDALASYIQNMLMQMAAEEVHMLLGVSDEIDNMHIKLQDLRNFLADADRRNITNQSVQAWATELRDAMYDATDILDLCQLMAMEQGPRHDAGCFNPLLVCLRNPLHAHDIGSRIKNLNKRLDSVMAHGVSFNFVNLGTYEELGRKKVSSSLGTRETLEWLDESDLVGEKIQEDTKNLVEMLTKEYRTHQVHRKIMVFAIVGVSGIGKTTLAQKIFNDDIIKHEFTKKIWLSVNQDFNDSDILRRVIAEAGGDSHVAIETRLKLERLLNETLKGHKTLLIMDDVWDHHAWEGVLQTPFVNGVANGSRVLITTRHNTVAQGMRAEEPYLHIRKLEPEDAWLLLKKQVVGIDHLKDIGMKILEECGGLPLAIKVVGGLLRTRYPSEGEWESVLNKPPWSLAGLPPELNNPLYLGYEDLSPQLKQCFLYCSLFPKGQKIVQKTITEMWVSEGFITASSRDQEDLAIECYEELINWNFIEPTEKYSLTGYVCTMHNVVRCFAEFMAREELLVVQREQQIEGIVGVGGQSKLLRRLSIESTESIPVEWAALRKLVSLRVLIINCKINFEPGDSLSSFSSLRVLHIVRLSDSDRLVSSLCQLKHLRYLYFYDSDISRLPHDIDQMKFLQYIGVVNCERFVQLPGTVVKLRQLRSLDLVGSNVHAVPRGFGSLTNLRSLLGFPVYTDDSRGQDWCNLEELEPLSQLRSLRLELEGIEKVDASHLAAKGIISSRWHHLSSLQLNYSITSRSSNVSNLDQQLIQEVYDKHLFPPPCLETLVMEGYIGCRLPKWMWASIPALFRYLMYMSLQNLASCTHLPDGLCQMPCLKRLEINKAPQIRHVGPEFLHHEYSFPRLQELVLEGMVEWREWEWNEMQQAMPVLEALIVKRCKLRSLPPGLSYHARALRRLVITGAPRLESLENFSSLVELEIYLNPVLTRIVGTPRLQKLTIRICPKLRVLEDVPALTSLVVEDYEMRTLPGYLLAIRPLYLTLDCSKKLLKSISMGEDGPEWKKISDIQHVRAYAEDGGYQRKCYVLYTREPYSLVVDTMLDSEEILTADWLGGSYTPSGSTGNITDDVELAGSDIPSGSKENLIDDDLLVVDNDIPSGSKGLDLLNNDTKLVGIESPREKIVKMLMHGPTMGKQPPQVVSICGIGGSGKTTVAEAVYRHIANQFECKAFISVSQGLADDENIIQRIFNQVGCPYPSLEKRVNRQQLIGTLKEFLQDKRYLIVVDGIWDVSVWDMISPALIRNYRRSGILVTTCKVNFAQSIGSVYRLPLLSEDDSKILFYRNTYFQTESGCSSEYRELTKRIINKCDRLPLAIITFASLLPNDSPNSPEEWKKVADSIGSGSSELGDSVKNMRKIISRSYDGLPQHLRTCFLYLFTVREDYVIRRDTLVQRWISEDLIDVDDGQNLQELGETYFYQLLNTGMIQPIEHDYDGKALACRVPVLMTDLIFSFANKEENNFRKTNKEENSSLEEEEDRSFEEEKIKSFQQRSLSISGSADSKKYIQINKNLRVLELEGSLGTQQFAKYIGSLHQLRYLVIASTQITAIPRRVDKLQFLQTLDLRATSVHELPCTIVRLKQLRCLLINRSTKVPAGISNLQALEELQDIDTTPDILEGICTLPELRFLRIAVRSWDESCGKPLPETLCKLITTKLKQLFICTSYSLEFKPGDIRKVLQHIEKLEIQHSTFGTLPTWIGPPPPAPPLVPTPAPPPSSEQVESHQTPAQSEVLLAADGRNQSRENKLGLGGFSSGTGAARPEPPQMRPNNGFKKLSCLSIEVYLLEMEGLKILAGLPELIFLSLTAKGPTVQMAKLHVPEGFDKLKTFHLFSHAIGIEFQQGSMEKLERLKLSFQASLATDDFSFGVENLSSLKYIQVEIICFSATEEAVKKAVDGIKGMILGSPKQPRPALHIRRTAEEDMIKDKGEVKEEFKGEVKEEFNGEVKEEVEDEFKGKIKEVKEELIGKVKEELKEELIGEFRELFIAALDRRVPLAQKEKEKEKEKERIALAQEEEEEEEEKNA